MIVFFCWKKRKLIEHSTGEIKCRSRWRIKGASERRRGGEEERVGLGNWERMEPSGNGVVRDDEGGSVATLLCSFLKAANFNFKGKSVPRLAS